ncbi:MAG: hypothetical protein J6D57_10310 [Mogibacterium sp.]|nr:hypothetical protein [Mogibacterium sp.]
MNKKVITFVIIIIILYAIRRKGDNMIDLYVVLIIAGKRPFSKVPARYQDAVREELLALGLDENGDPIKEGE